MLTTPVNLGDRSYNVLTGSGLLATSGSHARAIFPDAKRCALITDANVGPLYAATVADSLRAAQIDPTIITVPAGEPSKSFACLESVCRSMVSAGLDRKSFAIALGGGVIGDLAGFAASIFFRGIPFLQIPTTIVSVVDSSVGGKTGINTPEGKNLIGSFHQPRLVLIDPATLLSLPDREYHEGFAEVIKHAAIRDAAMLGDLETLARNPSRHHLDNLIARNVAIKAAIVSEDEFETKNIRALLNFGHTIGHGIEAFSWESPQRALLHGEAVAIGMLCAAYISWRSGLLPREANDRIAAQLRALYRPFELAQTDAHRIVQLMRNDKKNVGDEFRFTLLTAIGQGRVDVPVSAAQVQEAVEYYRLLVRE